MICQYRIDSFFECASEAQHYINYSFGDSSYVFKDTVEPINLYICEYHYKIMCGGGTIHVHKIIDDKLKNLK